MIGRYESSTGQIRWFDVPSAPTSVLAISPDGRYVVAFTRRWQDVVGSVDRIAGMIVLDLQSGDARTVRLPGACGFLGWRGPGQILVSQYAPPGPSEHRTFADPIEAVDLATAQIDAVYRRSGPAVDRMVIAPVTDRTPREAVGGLLTRARAGEVGTVRWS